jgi:hypothetical protein
MFVKKGGKMVVVGEIVWSGINEIKQLVLVAELKIFI